MTLPDHHREQDQHSVDYINELKKREQDFLHLIDICVRLFAADDSVAARDFALARTHLEDATMRAIRGVAKPKA